MNLTEIIRDLSDRIRVFKAINALAGGLYGVDSVAITAPGTGYTIDFAVTFSNGGTGTANVEDGEVVGVTILTRGSAVAGAVTVDWTAGAGTGAAGTTILFALTLDSVPTFGSLDPWVAMIDVAGSVFIYSLASGTDAEASPMVIRPDDYAGTTNEKVWKLQARFKDGSPLIRNDDSGLWHYMGVLNEDDGTPAPYVSDSGIA